MMNEAIVFDTHRFVKHLTESGFTEQQAEALAAAHVNLLNSNLVTKTDLKVAIESLKVELLKWMLGAMIAQVGLFVALVELLVT